MLTGVISLATLGTTAAFGTGIYNGVRVWLSGNSAAVVVRSFAMVREPTIADLRSAIAHATFPVVLPVGLPSGTHIWRIEFAPAARPNAVFIEYRNDRAKFNFGFALGDSSVVSQGVLPTGAGSPPSQSTYRWRVGRETVLVLKRSISLRDAERIKAAMMTASPLGSLIATQPMLSKATVLGIAPDLGQVAARYVPASGHTVVLGPQYPSLISKLAQHDKPLLDSRTVYLTDIPSIHGEPDYAKATLRWPHIIAISAAGVRAINAVLRFTGAAANCDCDILFNRPNQATYWVWELQRSPSATLTKYAVNAKTFAVTRTRE
ncbi:MAG: hypothetical protein M1314_03005 [Firmicutes bacterium]|nr:hypothetical protein [Bacillota bacterium]